MVAIRSTLVAASCFAGLAAAQATADQIKHIGYLVFPAFEVIDVFGPLSPLNMLSVNTTLKLSIISLTKDPVSSKPVAMPTPSNFGESIVPDYSLDNPPTDLDVLIVPGGPGTRAPALSLKPYTDFIASEYPKLKYLISVCTGASLLARSGVLDGRRATSNKFSWAFSVSTGPNVLWVPEARWVVDGNIWSTSGATSGLDGIFAWIKYLWGEDRALRIANILEYERHTDPAWDPFSAIWNATFPLPSTTTTTTSSTTTTSITSTTTN